MRFKAFLPQVLELAGEVIPEFAPPISRGPNPEPTKVSRKMDAKLASARMQGYLAKGLGKRAIVSFTPHHYTDDKVLDPINWGIIVDVDPFREHALHVRWADGKQSWTFGDDITVVYPCISFNELRAKRQGEAHIVH